MPWSAQHKNWARKKEPWTCKATEAATKAAKAAGKAPSKTSQPTHPEQTSKTAVTSILMGAMVIDFDMGKANQIALPRLVPFYNAQGNIVGMSDPSSGTSCPQYPKGKSSLSRHP